MNYFKWLLVSVLTLILVACGQQTSQNTTSKTGRQQDSAPLALISTPISRTETMLHTVVRLQIFHEGQEAALEEAFAYLTNMENMWSHSIKTSDIAKINAAAGQEAVPVSQETIDLIKKAATYTEKTNGKFDISIGSVVHLWGIGGDNPQKPSQSAIDQAVSAINYQHILIDDENNTVKLADEGMEIELGAISKGYLADGVRTIFEKHGITSAIINLGGNVIVMGNSPKDDKGWKVGVQDPDAVRGAVVGSIYLTNESIVTSGIYEQYFEYEGEKYHHILDPSTGYPVNNSISGVSVFTKASVDGDALSTSLFLLGLEDGMALIENTPNVEAAFILKDKSVILSTGIKDKFTLTNENYHLAEMPK